MAAMITRMMGHRAAANPSSAEVRQSSAGMCHSARASTAARIRALKQAMCPGSFRAARAMMSQMMGTRAMTDNNMGTTLLLAKRPAENGRPNWFYHFVMSQVPRLGPLRRVSPSARTREAQVGSRWFRCFEYTPLRWKCPYIPPVFLQKQHIEQKQAAEFSKTENLVWGIAFCEKCGRVKVK